MYLLENTKSGKVGLWFNSNDLDDVLCLDDMCFIAYCRLECVY